MEKAEQPAVPCFHPTLRHKMTSSSSIAMDGVIDSSIPTRYSCEADCQSSHNNSEASAADDTTTCTSPTPTNATPLRRRLTLAASSALACLFIAVVCDDRAPSRLSGWKNRVSKSKPIGRHNHMQPAVVAAGDPVHFELDRTLEEDEGNDGDDGDDENNNDDNNNNNDNDEEDGNENDDDNANQANDDNDDAQQANGDDAVNDDQAANNNNDDAQAQYDDDLNGDMNADDYFYDGINDDYATDDASTIDDFYAFEEDPRPPDLFPLTSRVVIGYTVAAMALTLGASGGIGGGGIVVPVFILIMGLQPKVAIPVGAMTVFGGSIASTAMNWTRRHPLADRPLIDWDLVLVMEPFTLVGTLIGTLFHRVFSEKFLVVLLVLLLSFTAHATLSKAMRMYDAEKRYIRHLKAAQADPPSGSPPHGYHWGVKSNDTADNLETNGDDSSGSRLHMDEEEKQRILIVNPDFVTLRSEVFHEEKFTPRSKIIALMCMFFVMIFLNIMVGGGAYKSPWDIDCGSVAFWVIQIIMIAFLIASAWAAQTYLVARHEIKEFVRFDYVHGDIKWDARSAIIYPAVFISAGLFAGMFGIGGGIIIVPIMLAMGVHPSVASATSSAMILFTSFASSTSYIVFGLLLKDYASAGFLVGFIFSLLGQRLMKKARQAKSASGRTFERNSYIAFVIGGVVLISALLMTIQYVFMIADEPEDDGGLCDGLGF